MSDPQRNIRGLNTATARERFDEYRRRAYAIAQNLTLNVPVAVSDDEMGQMVGLTRNQVAVMSRLMVHVGAAERPGRGLWLLKMPTDQMFHALDLEMERQMRGGMSVESHPRGRARKGVTRQSEAKVAVLTDRIGLPVAAVVGPDQPNALAPLKGMGPDAPGALIAAAKQYRGGVTDDTRQAMEMVKQLAAMGIEPPDELVNRAKPRLDERLETIRLVLPYIEALERQLVAFREQVASMADYGGLKQENSRLREQLQRRVAASVAESMRDRVAPNKN